MSRFGRFVFLALVGFLIGGAFAYFTEVQPSQQEVVVEGSVPAMAAVADPHAGHVMPAQSAEEKAPVATATASAVGGAFDLIDQNGQQVTEKSFPDKFKLVFFGFTYCPDICPAAMTKLTEVVKTLGDKGNLVQVQLFSIDPERDTPERLKEFLAAYDMPAVGLTGPADKVREAQAAYKVYAARAEGGDAENYVVDHSAFIYLMDRNNNLLQIFRKDDPAAEIAGTVGAYLRDVEK